MIVYKNLEQAASVGIVRLRRRAAMTTNVLCCLALEDLLKGRCLVLMGVAGIAFSQCSFRLRRMWMKKLT